MTVTINGSGTIGGISVGGLNDNIITKNEMATGGAWAPAGTVLQVVQGTTASGVTIATSTYTDIGLTATITPSSATNKILVVVTTLWGLGRANAEEGNGINIVRDSTSIWNNGTDKNGYFYVAGASTISMAGTTTVSYLDSPSKTTATVYKVQGAIDNPANSGSVTYQAGSKTSTITLMEIAA